MKKLFYFLFILLFINKFTIAQGIHITPGANFKTTGNVSIVIENGGITNDGAGDFSAADVYLTRTSDTAALSGTGKLNFGNLHVNKTAGFVRLERNISIVNNLVFKAGNVDLNNHNLTLSSAGAILNEKNTSRVIGPIGGEIIISLPLNAPANVNPGNLGAVISSSKDLGLVTIRRGHAVQKQSGTGKSIKRYYTITPEVNTSLNATLRIKYFNSELNGLDESQLEMFRSTDNGTSWTNLGHTTRSATEDYVQYKPIGNFKRYTLSTPGFSVNAFAASTVEVSGLINKNSDNGFRLYPNPTDNEIVIVINAAKNTKKAIILVNDIYGKTILRRRMTLSAGENMLSLNTAHLASGNYMINLVIAGEKQRILKMVKN